MSKTAQYITFYSVFLFVFFGMHLYVYAAVEENVFPAPPSYWYFTAVLLLALSFPVCTLLEKFFPSTFTMLLYTVAASWLGVLFLLLSTLALLEPTRPFVNINTPLVGRCVVVFVAALSLIRTHQCAVYQGYRGEHSGCRP